jgi:hypothetical protein
MARSSSSRLVACSGLLLLAAVPVIAGFAGTDVFLPMVGRQPGVFPSDWYTTVWIYNPSADAVVARLYLLERNTANPSPPWVDVTVPPGDTQVLENVVETLFHAQVFGAMRVTAPAKLVVTSRVYSKGPGAGDRSSVGQDFAGVPAAFAIGIGEKTQVLGTYQTLPTADSDFRYNFGFVETSGHTVTVRVRAFDATGAEQGSKDIQVREFSQRQVAFKDNFPGISTENTRLEMEVISGTGKVIAYGSGIANGSQDPTTYEMEYKDSLLGAVNIQHDTTLKGDGTAGAPLGIAEGGVGTSLLPDLAVTADKLADEAVTVHKLATVQSPLPAPEGMSVSAARADDPLEQFFKMGDWMFWAPAFTGDITAVFTDPGSGLTGGMTWADAHLAIADLGVTTARLADGAVTPAKLAASGPGGSMQEKLAWVPNAGMQWQTDLDDVWPKGVVWGSSQPIYAFENTMHGAAFEGISAGGTGLSGKTTTGTGVHGTAADGIAVRGDATGDFSPIVSVGVLGTNTGGDGVRGEATTGSGVHGKSLTGAAVLGENYGNSGNAGHFEISEGRNLNAAVEASTEGFGPAVLGRSHSGTYRGYLGRNGAAVYGEAYGQINTVAHAGLLGSGQYGAYGQDAVSGFYGFLGSADFGAYGANAGQTVYGYLASAENGVGGRNGNNWGRIGTPDYAAYFNGSVRVTTLGHVTGNLPVYATAAGVLTTSSSDTRLKKNVAALTDAVDVVAALAKLRGVTFNWDTSVARARDLGEQQEIGMIAQEVEAVLPQVVGAGADGYRSLDYAKLTAFLIEVAKAQQAEIDELRAALGMPRKPGSR